MKYQIIPVTNFLQNCSIIWCKTTGKATIVDPGGEPNRIKNEIKKINIQSKISIEKILITHGHIDHIGSAEELSTYYGVPILGPHEKEKNLLQNISEQCKILKIPLHNFLLFNNIVWLSEKDKISFGHISFEILHCPGHSPGHIIFVNKKNKIIFSGDLLFKGSVGRTDLPEGNVCDLIQSLTKILSYFSDDYTLIPGHGPITTIGEEKKHNSFLKKLLSKS